MRQFGWTVALAIGIAVGARGQSGAQSSTQSGVQAAPSDLLDPLSGGGAGLPDSPGATKGQQAQQPPPPPKPAESAEPWWLKDPNPQSPAALGLAAPCRGPGDAFASKQADAPVRTGPCPANRAIYKPFVDADTHPAPLSSRQKAKLAIHDIKDPFNLLTIAGTSAYFIGTTPHNPYGPGLRGFGYNAGVDLSLDVMGETIGTFLVCSTFHQDPRYFRMPHASIPRRVAHAVAHVAIAQSDDGKTIPNYANFITSAALSEIANAYVPGLATDGASTAERIFDGFLTEPIGTLIAEFLPDVASHIHVRVVLMQRILNQISGQPPQPQTAVGAP